MKDFREFDVWRKAMALALLTYRTTQEFPRSELFGLTGQMRRSAISVASNIAEGNGRGTPRDFARFLRVAYGSACELETQARIATDLGLGANEDLRAISARCDEIRRMLHALITTVAAEAH